MGLTKIEWTDYTWNPVTGCSPRGPECNHCYARSIARRFAGVHYPAENPFQVTLRPERLNEPFEFKSGSGVFVCSMGDLFHEHVPFNFIDRVFDTMIALPLLTFQILTKRPARLFEYLQRRGVRAAVRGEPLVSPFVCLDVSTFVPHVWFGVSCGTQANADRWVPILLRCPVGTRFVSCEPLLERVNLREWLSDLDWVIAGAETGAGARPMDPAWAIDLRDQCEEAGRPFFMKSMGPKVNKPPELEIAELPGKRRNAETGDED